jgi:hypothetical protein
MKEKVRTLLQRIGSERLPQWTWWRRRRSTDRVAPWGIRHDETGYTIHRDVALRLKNLSVDKASESLGDPGLEVGAFKIRIAEPPQVRREAEAIVTRRYVSRGYRTSATMISTNVSTFAAYDEGRLAGTVSLRLDSKDGLNADLLYHEEIERLRAKGYKICEFTRLAVDTSRVSKPVLAGLFHTVYLYAQNLRGFNFVVIEVNPRHVEYYERQLGFSVLGEQRENPRVEAPAVLMGVSFDVIADNLHRHAGKGKRPSSSRSFYVHGFSPSEEEGILGRLKNIDKKSR